MRRRETTDCRRKEERRETLICTLTLEWKRSRVYEPFESILGGEIKEGSALKSRKEDLWKKK